MKLLKPPCLKPSMWSPTAKWTLSTDTFVLCNFLSLLTSLPNQNVRSLGVKHHLFYSLILKSPIGGIPMIHFLMIWVLFNDDEADIEVYIFPTECKFMFT